MKRCPTCNRVETVELEKAYRERDWRLSAVVKAEPLIESLRDDPRYKDLLKRMGLPE